MAEELENSAEVEETKKGKKKKKKKDKQIDTALNSEYELDERGGGMSTVVVTIAIVIIWLAVFAILIKWDVGHFGSSVLYPVLKDVPVINMILRKWKKAQKKQAVSMAMLHWQKLLQKSNA